MQNILRKDLTESVANIWDYTGGFRKLIHDLRKFHKLKLSILQVELWFRKLNMWFRNLLNCISMAIVLHFSSDLYTVWSIELLTSQALKLYIVCIKWTPRSSQNVFFSCSPLEFLHVRFLSPFFLLAFLIGFGKGLRSSKAWILHVNELPFALLWTIQSSPSFLDCFGDQKAIKNTKTCHNLIRNTCKGP